MMRFPQLPKSLLDELLAWFNDTLPPEEAERPADDMRRQRRSRSGPGTKRRRGVRRWVVSASSPDAAASTVPDALRQLLEWLFRGMSELGHDDGAPWRTTAMEELVPLVMGGELPLLRSLFRLTAQVLHGVQAHSTRLEMLQSLYNAVIWHLDGAMMARAYIEHLLVPQFAACAVGGIPRITGMTLHYDEGRNEWYISTEGSNFAALYNVRSGLCIDRPRCFTTNVVEILACLGLEAVCSVFSNGDLARSLGVNNASCKLLVDQLSSRGVWRGVNRTSIVVGAAVLASITVEDPIKHVRHAAFTGQRDNLTGSSANVLTGGPITFGTNGMSLLLHDALLTDKS